MKKPKFKPKPGQIDFTSARYAPVVNCVLKHKNEILIVQRSKSLNFYPGYWNGISGFLDDKKILKEKVTEELKEELGMNKKYISSITLGKIFHQEEKKYKKTWIVHPVLVKVKTKNVKLDWEAQGYRWIGVKDVEKFNLMPGFGQVLKNLSD